MRLVQRRGGRASSRRWYTEIWQNSFCLDKDFRVAEASRFLAIFIDYLRLVNAWRCINYVLSSRLLQKGQTRVETELRRAMDTEVWQNSFCLDKDFLVAGTSNFGNFRRLFYTYKNITI